MWMQIELAADILKLGGVIAYPTETVYGLGCDPDNEDAVRRILRIKKRPVSKGLILLADSVERLLPWVELSEHQQQILSRQWPSATSYLVPAGPACRDFIRGQHECVAVRVTAHPIVRSLCEKLGKPLVSTSANRAGKMSLTQAFQVALHLGSEVDFIVTGQGEANARPSTIRNLVTGEIVRP